MDAILNLNPILLYFLIFTGKIIEVGMATVRIVLITKGEKLKGSVIGFFEVLLWVAITATVLVDIAEDPFKVVVVSLAFAAGNYFGSIVENKLNIGTVKIEAVVKKTEGKRISRAMREMGFALTAIDAYGRDERREILYMHVPRKYMEKATRVLREMQADAVITINDIRPLFGGHGILRK